MAADVVALDPLLLEVLACPSPDHAPVEVVGDPQEPVGLRCTYCASTFPVVDGIPVMLLEEAVPGPAGLGRPSSHD